jgi:integrase/recombinase XerD
MFETLYRAGAVLARHREGPLAAERERYLQHCVGQGGTQISLRLRAQSILWVAERMSPADFGALDSVRLHEIVRTSVRPALAPTTAATRVAFARPWLKFLGWWREPQKPIAFERELERFVSWMRDERGLTPCTIDQWRYRTATFLRWCGDTDRSLATLRPEDIDTYFINYGAQRWSRISVRHVA